MKIIKQLFCKHERVVHDSTDLVRQKDGSFITSHKWRCERCGKIIPGKK